MTSISTAGSRRQVLGDLLTASSSVSCAVALSSYEQPVSAPSRAPDAAPPRRRVVRLRIVWPRKTGAAAHGRRMPLVSGFMPPSKRSAGEAPPLLRQCCLVLCSPLPPRASLIWVRDLVTPVLSITIVNGEHGYVAVLKGQKMGDMQRPNRIRLLMSLLSYQGPRDQLPGKGSQT